MKKIIVILSIVIVFVIGFSWTFHYISRDGEFSKMSHTTVMKEHFEDGNTFYMRYDFNWEGIGNPTLEKVEFIKRDGTIVAQDDNEFHIEPFIATGKAKISIGAVDEAFIMKEGLKKDLVPFKGFQVEKDFPLILRVEFNGANIDNDIEGLRITYKKYGVTQFQNIPFEHIMIHDYEND